MGGRADALMITARPRKGLGGVLLVVAAAMGVYATTLGHGFLSDDEHLILDNRYLADWSELGENLTSDFFRRTHRTGLIGYWRPVVTLSYMIDRTLFAERPWGFHLVNVLAHALASVLVLGVARRLPLPRGAPEVAALLFAVHPAHVESVAWVSGRTDVFCAVFVLGAVWLDVEHARRAGRGRRGASVALAALALLSKETAAVVPAVIALRVLVLPGTTERAAGRARAALWGALPYSAVVIAYGLVRVFVLGIVPRPPAAALEAGRWALFWTWWHAFVEYVRVLVWPAVLTTDLPLEVHGGPWSVGVVAGLGLFVAVGFVAVRAWRRAPSLTFALGFFVLGLVPVTNVVVSLSAPDAEAFAWHERFLYLPSFGFCVAAGWALRGGWTRNPAGPSSGARTVLVAATVVAVTALAARTVDRGSDWKDGLSLWRATLERNPASTHARISYGVELANRGRLDEAAREYRRVLRHDPDDHRALFNLGNVHLERGEPERAEASYRAALASKPTHAPSHVNLGLVLFRSGRTDEALEAFSRADALLPGYVEAKVNRAHVLLSRSRVDEALRLYREALELDEDRVEARLGVATCLLARGDVAGSESEVRSALREAPELAEAHLLLGVVLERSGRREEAERAYREALRLDPDDPKLLRRFGLQPPE